MFQNLLVGYIGPETILPLASFFAAILGGIMIGWRYIVGFASRMFSYITGRKNLEESSDVSTSADSPID